MERNKYFEAAVELLKLAWKDDDLMEQDTLFDLQEKLANFTLQVAMDEGKAAELVKEFPYLYRAKGT